VLDLVAMAFQPLGPAEVALLVGVGQLDPHHEQI
jgi:hypothetical protein